MLPPKTIENLTTNTIPTAMWPQKIHLIYYLLIFICGVFSAYLLFILAHIKIAKYNLPNTNYLQLRDEFQIISQYVPDNYHQHNNAADGNGGDGDGLPPHKQYKKEKLEADQQEALSSLKVAMELQALGKDDKALRLFRHAMALAPKHPDILTNFGEYLEHSRRDIVSADRLYVQVRIFFGFFFVVFNTVNHF